MTMILILPIRKSTRLELIFLKTHQTFPPLVLLMTQVCVKAISGVAAKISSLLLNVQG